MSKNLKDVLFGRKFSEHTLFGFYLDKIIDFIESKDDNHRFYLQDIASNIDVDTIESEEDFICAAFYLTRKDINIFNQCFEVVNVDGSKTDIEDKEIVIDCLRNEEYFHPFTRETMTIDEYAQVVQFYFERIL